MVINTDECCSIQMKPINSDESIYIHLNSYECRKRQLKQMNANVYKKEEEKYWHTINTYRWMEMNYVNVYYCIWMEWYADECRWMQMNIS